MKGVAHNMMYTRHGTGAGMVLGFRLDPISNNHR